MGRRRAFAAFDLNNTLFKNIRKNKINFVKDATADVNKGNIVASNTSTTSTFVPTPDSMGRYLFIKDSYSTGHKTSSTATPVFWVTNTLDDTEFVNLVNGLPEMRTQTKHTTKAAAQTWALANNYVINVNNEVYPSAITDSIVANIDYENPLSFLGQAGTNMVPLNSTLNPYNNPGFATTSTWTDEYVKGSRVRKITFTPQDAAKAVRLTSTEGFGCYHTMGAPLYANTYYLASIYFKSHAPINVNGFSHGYSNISGWNANSTSTTKYEENNWYRLYTRYYRNNYNTGGVYYSERSTNPNNSFVVNTTATTDITLTYTVNASTLSDSTYLYSLYGANPYVSNAGGVSGLATGTGPIIAHGLDTTNWTKLSSSNMRLKAQLPITYYVKVRVPSTGGVNKTIYVRPRWSALYTALTDSKYWKIRFLTGTANETFETFWAAPMIEQKSTIYPSEFYSGTLTTANSIKDVTGNSTITIPAISYTSQGRPTFDGTDDYITVNAANHHTSTRRSIEMVFKANAQSSTYNPIAVYTNTSSINSYKRIWLGLQSGKFRMHGWGTNDPNSTTSISNGVYYHVVYAYDQGTKKHWMWVNGNLESNLTNTETGMTGWTNSATEQWFLGRDPLASSWTGGAGQYFNGEIPVFRLYNKLLTTTEVQDSFNSLRANYNI